MENNDRYNNAKTILETGEKDLLIIGKHLGYNGKTEKSIKDSTRRFIYKHETLKLLFKDSEKSMDRKEKKINYDVANNQRHVPNVTGLDGISSWDELVEKQSNNPFLMLLNKKLQDIENNNASHNDNNIEDGYTFMLEDKYLEIDQDDIVTASLRLSRKVKKKLDNFAKEHGQFKKVLLVSQIIEESIDKYRK